MIRWLYLCSDLGIPLDGTKGASEHVRAITRALASAGHEVCVLAARGRLPDGHPARQIEAAIGREARATGELLREWLARVDAPAGLAGDVAQMSCDARLWQVLADDHDIPRVHVVLERLSLFCSAGAAFARRRGVPYLLEVNAPLAEEAARYREAGMQSLARQLEDQRLAGADLVLTVSETLRRHLIQQGRVGAERVVTVPNGVDLPLFNRPVDRAEARARAGLPPTGVVFGFAGSLKAWHGLETLLEAFAVAGGIIPDSRLLIVGEGRLRDHYQARARQLGIDGRTVFHGGVAHDEMPTLLRAMDVGVAPYLPQEHFYFSPLKLYEYMAAGLCIVASRAGQIAETIEHGRNGLLVTPGHPQSLADALILAGRDVGLRDRLAQAARGDADGRGWDRVAGRITELAGAAMASRATRREEPAHA